MPMMAIQASLGRSLVIVAVSVLRLIGVGCINWANRGRIRIVLNMVHNGSLSKASPSDCADVADEAVE